MSMTGVNQFIDRIREAGRRADLDSLPGPYLGRSLREDLAQLVAEHHIRRTARERGPAGPWAPLSPRYLARKLREGYPATIGVRTGEMLNPRQFLDAPSVASNNFLVVGYGVTESARRKMRYFGRRRPALGPDAELRAAIRELIGEALALHLQASGVGRRGGR